MGAGRWAAVSVERDRASVSEGDSAGRGRWPRQGGAGVPGAPELRPSRCLQWENFYVYLTAVNQRLPALLRGPGGPEA